MHFLIRLERKPEQVHCSWHSCTASILPKEEVKALTKPWCEGAVEVCVVMASHTPPEGNWCESSRGNAITDISLRVALQP